MSEKERNNFIHTLSISDMLFYKFNKMDFRFAACYYWSKYMVLRKKILQDKEISLKKAKELINELPKERIEPALFLKLLEGTHK